jgi:hypothetical protein
LGVIYRGKNLVKNKRIAYFIITFFFFIASGCTDSLPKGKGDFAYDLMVNITDLSNQFVYVGGDFPPVDGAFSYRVKYVNKNNETGAIISHQITFYSDSNTASENYSTWESKWFDEGWISPSESIYKPQNLADRYQMGCTDGKSMIYLQGVVNFCNFIIT